MLVGFRTGISHPASYYRFSVALNPQCNHSLTHILGMGTQSPAKRPFCLSCSKPARLCLCSRFKTPSLDNSIAVTILQHSQERKHPLNSTRIAILGLKNLTVATDVHSEAQFLIRLLKANFETTSAASGANSIFCSCQNYVKNPNFDRHWGFQTLQEPLFEGDLELPIVGTKLGNRNEETSDFLQVLVSPEEKQQAFSTNNQSVLEVDHESTISRSNGRSGSVNLKIPQSYLEKQSDSDQVLAPTMLNRTVSDSQNQGAIPQPENLLGAETDQIEEAPTGEKETLITATIAKCGYTCSLTHLQTPQNDYKKPDFDRLLDSQAGQDAISNGFVVKKLQKRKLDGSMEFEECEEFEIAVPPGTALLFPTKKSISLEAVDFPVKGLIVLDGTWAKAKRMYHENPWLKLLPHLKLDPSKLSLYSEVRHQPRAGCLSTIESIVCALKALGDDGEALDDLLDVFESMVGDQRRCKDERLNKTSPP